MAARCSFPFPPVALPSVPSGIAQGPQIVSLRSSGDVGLIVVLCPPNYPSSAFHIQALHPTSIHVVEHESPWNPYPVEEDLIGMDFLPHLRITEHPIGSPPAGACPTGNYTASPLSCLEDATTNAVPPPSFLPPTPPPSSSLHHDHVPRAFHGVERRQRSRSSSRGGADYHYLSKLTRGERAALKTAPSRRVAFAEHAHQIASSSLWTPDGALPASTVPVSATATGKLKHRRPPTPGHVASFDVACASFGDERDESPGFDADVEFEPAEGAQHCREQVGDKERLTIIVPGGKSEAYVAMAFERSCSLGADDADDEDDGNEDDCPASPVHPDMSTSEKTGLKIRIPMPNPLFMLSLRMASSCRVSDGVPEDEDTGDDDAPQLQLGMMMQDRDRERDQCQDLNSSLVVRARSAFSRSPTPPVAPPPSPVPFEGRAERRVARRSALAPYCAIDRLHVSRASERLCLPH